MTQGGRSNQRRVLDPDTVVHLVFVLDPAQDRDRILDTRLIHHHRLEPAGKGRVFLDVFTVFIQRGRTNAVQITTGKRGL